MHALIRIRETARSSRTGTTACLPGDHKWHPQSNTGTYCPQHAQCRFDRNPSARGAIVSKRTVDSTYESVNLKPHSNGTISACCFPGNREKKQDPLSRDN